MNCSKRDLPGHPLSRNGLMSSPIFVWPATASFSICPQETERKKEQKGTRLIFKKEAGRGRGGERGRAGKKRHIGKRSLNKIQGVGLGWLHHLRHTHTPAPLLAQASKSRKEYEMKRIHLARNRFFKTHSRDRERKILMKIWD